MLAGFHTPENSGTESEVKILRDLQIELAVSLVALIKGFIVFLTRLDSGKNRKIFFLAHSLAG